MPNKAPKGEKKCKNETIRENGWRGEKTTGMEKEKAGGKEEKKKNR